MTTEAPDRLWSGIDLTRILGGALAAVCAAVAGSFLGVAGTLVGAAVASVIGSVGTEIYSRSINRGTKKLQSTLAPAFIKAPAAVGTPPVEAATEEDSPSHTVAESTDVSDPAANPAPKAKPGIRWKRVALAAGLLFVLAMSAIFVVELMAGRSVASMVGQDSSGGTTLGSVVDGNSSGEAPAPVVSVTPTDGGTPAGTPTGTPSPTATEGGTPTPGQTAAPTTGAPTEAPATEAPQQTTPPGGSTGDQPGTQQQQQDSGTE